jgi:protein TonB
MSRLTIFLLASTALHAGLIAGGVALGKVDAGTRMESIAVRLDEVGHGARPAPSLPVARTAPVSTMPSDTVVRAVSAATQQATDWQVAPSPGEAAASVQAQVLSDLARHFYYPAVARSRGWEGRVLLAFRVEQDGLLHELHVVRTSGFGVLDEAALNSLRKVERVADAGGTRHDMQIPVVYRLTDKP